MSAAVDHPISQALIILLHYIIEKEDEGKGGKNWEEGEAMEKGGQLVKH